MHHPSAGISWGYRGLTSKLPNLRIYGVQASGLDGASPLSASIEEMVTDYVDRLVLVQPEGVVQLLGGTVAHAMAVELTRRGRRVGYLGLMDAKPAVPGQVFAGPGDAAASLESLRHAVKLRFAHLPK
ncbi:thioesterase domain-containing protein [Rhodococcoides kyotonense]|uniref:thioesterase domain-containing protein n=1 Tax=Rhodococcoides kyotonense TaxID=398843 RepID=UPI0015961238|nr:thioesterase domain-containing protein [Rhodococcus kyotonensis]